MAGMVIKSVRFGPRQSDLVSRMAELEGVSVSQYIRDAAFARAMYDAATRGDGGEQLWKAMCQEAPSLAPMVELLL